MSTNILKPELVWIEGRCYRNTDTSVEMNTFEEHDLYENDTVYKDSDENEENDDIEVVALDDSRFSTSFHVSKHYLGAIIGKKGYTKSRIEHDTKTEIKIPRQGKDGDITILGPSAANVKAARRRINMIVMSSRMKQKPTHFISIPMNNPDIVNNFIKFQETVLRNCQSRGIEESIFIKPNKVHLTLGVMCLMDNEERNFACKILTEAKDKVIMPLVQGQMPIKIRMKGLSYMNDDPKEIDVLYANVEEFECTAGILQQIADGVVDHFNREGMAGDIGEFDDYSTEIAETDDSRYTTRFHVSKKYLGLMNGAKIEQDTKTEIWLPKLGQEEDITIFGATADSVIAAKRQIDMIVLSSRMKQRPTHFISIPLNNAAIVNNFTRFKEAVLHDCQNRGIEESIFIHPSKLHLTIGVMCLTDNEERSLASNLLTEAKEKIIMPLLQDHLPLKIKMKGLSYMKNDPKNINVLYAKVEEFEVSSGILQRLADAIVEYFDRKGFMNKKEFGLDTVHLHVTLLNTKYRKKSRNIRVSKNKRVAFDGSDILEKFGDYDFGVLELIEIHLSYCYATGPNGYYQPTCIISIP